MNFACIDSLIAIDLSIISHYIYIYVCVNTILFNIRRKLYISYICRCFIDLIKTYYQGYIQYKHVFLKQLL